MKQFPVISIITIVYNGESTLEKTIQSIAAQSYPHIEYLIVDGASTDRTLSIIKKYETTISQWISEPDKGLYEAMNKGLKMATGDYLWFINSGDEIYEPNTISKLLEDATEPYADVYYGDTVMIDAHGNTIGDRRLQPPPTLTWHDFKNGMLVSHQSILIKRELADLYNLNYQFSADYEWCLSALKKAQNTVNTHQVLSRFLDGGITKQNIVPGLKERFKIMKQHFGFLPTVLRHIPIGLKFFGYVLKHKRF